jgi:hypothetical protein
MLRIDEMTQLPTLAATDATASTMAGGQAYLADVARQLAQPLALFCEGHHR